ncbi:MAG: nitrogen fixation NifU-like protein [Saprospiraceae bacterium]|jgi:nitrogen fixation NifU-like protein
MNEQLKKLYQSVILKNNNDPSHFEKREEASYVLEAYNQICGDRFKLYFDIENDKITQLSFHGFGCAISKASTSVLVKKIEGKTPEQVKSILNSFLNTVKPDQEIPENTEDDFLAFAAARDFPGRLKCATLSWEEMGNFLTKNLKK